MIQINQLTASYDGKNILHFPDWSLGQGQQSLILGTSGSGKTTLLHMLAGILKPRSGTIAIGETDITQMSSSRRDHFRGRNIGLIFQKAHLLPSLTVKDNLLAAQYFAGLKQDSQRVREVLAELNIEDRLNRHPYELSQGEAQRASIARAVLNKPKVILADEPTSSLDDRNCTAVAKLLMEEAKRYQATLVISTHDQRLKDLVPLHLIIEKESVFS